MRAILFPQDLVNKIDTLHQELGNLTAQLSDKDDKIVHLENIVETLENELDSMQQYSRRPNLREYMRGENLEEKLIDIVKKMHVTLPIARNDLERCHRLGRPVEGQTKPRNTIVCFRSERCRDSVYRASGGLKDFNKTNPTENSIFVDEDPRRSKRGFETRKLEKANRINDCWTARAKIIIKDNPNTICETTSLKTFSNMPRPYIAASAVETLCTVPTADSKTSTKTSHQDTSFQDILKYA